MPSNWVFIPMDPHHKHWESFSKIIKLDQLKVDRGNPIKEVVVKIHDTDRSVMMKSDVQKKYKITNEFISDEQSMIAIYEHRGEE